VNKGAILYSFLSFSSSVDLNHLEQLKIANQLTITLPVRSYLKNLHHLQPATTMTDSTAAITALSTEPALSPIATSTEEPTYASLKRAQQQLNSHATSIHSHGGDGSHGHLALTVSAATYISITGTPFQAPVNPTAQPNHPRGSEEAEITELNRQHLVNQKTYRLYQQTDKSLRNQLITAVPLLYIEDLLDDTIGWGNTTCLQLLDHLWETYGTITAVELEANIATMKEPWNTESPIQTVFTQLKDAIAFSKAGQGKTQFRLPLPSVLATPSLPTLASSKPPAENGATHQLPITPFMLFASTSLPLTETAAKPQPRTTAAITAPTKLPAPNSMPQYLPSRTRSAPKTATATATTPPGITAPTKLPTPNSMPK
jgi:hypothetical protein